MGQGCVRWGSLLVKIRHDDTGQRAVRLLCPQPGKANAFKGLIHVHEAV